jgi:hypothetical protein
MHCVECRFAFTSITFFACTTITITPHLGEIPDGALRPLHADCLLPYEAGRGPGRQACGAQLPCAQSCDADTNHEGELCLRRVKFCPDAFHISQTKRGDARWLKSTPSNLPGLFDTCQQLLTRRVFHLKSSRTNWISGLLSEMTRLQQNPFIVYLPPPYTTSASSFRNPSSHDV